MCGLCIRLFVAIVSTMICLIIMIYVNFRKNVGCGSLPFCFFSDGVTRSHPVTIGKSVKV
jgi:hypothetical protein